MFSKTSREKRAIIFLVVVVLFGVVLYIPATKSYIYENFYMNTFSRKGRVYGYQDDSPGWSTNKVAVMCPYNSSKPILSTDPRYDPVKGESYCMNLRASYSSKASYLIPVLLVTMIALGLNELRLSKTAKGTIKTVKR